MNEDPKLALIGVELSHGQGVVCVALSEWRDHDSHFAVRHLERLPHRMSYPKIAQRLEAIVANLRGKASFSVCTYINATDVGLPVVDLIRKHAPNAEAIAVKLNHGDQVPTVRDGVTVLGWASIVSRLQALLQTGHLQLPTERPDVSRLADEVHSYDHSPVPNAEEIHGAFKVGTQDALVKAIGLAVHKDHPRP